MYLRKGVGLVATPTTVRLAADRQKMAATSRRALHFVFKVADRTTTVRFYREILGMKVLRHEEFEEGCKAACNGPYDGKWSKSMVGYGPEDSHFVVELTYNYGIKQYMKGNDFQCMTIHSKAAVENAKKHNWPSTQGTDGALVVEAPGGYLFHLHKKDAERTDPVYSVTLSVSNLVKSLEFWHGLLGMTVVSQDDTTATLCYHDNQAKLELVQIAEPMDHAEAFGRIAFSCPRTELPTIEQSVKEAGHTILTPLVSLDTPGKATVEVVILADPDGHEICFVGDEAFRELSQMDPSADDLITKAIKEDKSDEWFAGKNRK